MTDRYLSDVKNTLDKYPLDTDITNFFNMFIDEFEYDTSVEINYGILRMCYSHVYPNQTFDSSTWIPIHISDYVQILLNLQGNEIFYSHDKSYLNRKPPVVSRDYSIESFTNINKIIDLKLENNHSLLTLVHHSCK